MEIPTKFNRVTGDEAYSIWFGYNEGDSEYFDAMMTVELDLELIVGANGEVYASRSNLPFPLPFGLKEVVLGNLPKTQMNSAKKICFDWRLFAEILHSINILSQEVT